MLAKNSNYLGKQVGSYNIISCLGSGGFADVYLGEHIYLKTQSAIKTLHIQLSERALQNFLNEAKIIARLEHPHIIRIFDYGVQDGRPFLVMSYAPNGTLRQRYPFGTCLPLGLIVSYVHQAASVLDYAHQLKLIHRDVKPENMLIGQQQQLLLSDFGLALAVSSTDSQPGISMPGLASNSQPALSMIGPGSISQPEASTAGTMPYMAPEQIQGKACYASDQYALAIIAYEWICGEYPFTGSFLKIASQHVLTPPPSLIARVPHLPPGVEQVIFKALAKDPSQRFASVSDFAQALQQVCQTDASTSILTYKNTSTTVDEELIPQMSFNPTEKSQQSIMSDASMEQSELDRSHGNDTSLDLYALDSAKTTTPSRPELHTSHLSSNSDYSTLQLPAQASITYNTSRLPFIFRNTSNTSHVSDIARKTPKPSPTPDPDAGTPNIPLTPNTNHSTPVATAQPHKRKLHLIIRGAAIVALLIGGVSLGAIWHANTYANHPTDQKQQHSTLSDGNTQQTNHNTGKGSPTGTTPTAIASIPANTGNISTMPTTTTEGTKNPPLGSSTPMPTSPSISTPIPPPTPMAAADCLQGSTSNLSFASKANPVVPRKHSFTLTNCGGTGSQNWMANVQSSGWLSLNLSGGSINPGASVTLQVLTNVNGMDTGRYVGSITFTAGTASWNVNVVYTINSTGNAQTKLS